MGTLEGNPNSSSLDSVCVELEKASKVLTQNDDSTSQAKSLENALKVHIKSKEAKDTGDSASHQRLFQNTEAFLAALSRAPSNLSIETHSREFRKWATCVPALVQINGFSNQLVKYALQACKSGLAIRSVIREDNDDVTNGELVSRSTLQSLCARMVAANNCPRASLEAGICYISSQLVFASDNFILLNLFARTLVRLCSSLKFISRTSHRLAFHASYRSTVCLLRIASCYVSNIGSVLPECGVKTVSVQRRSHADNYQSMKVVKFILEHVHSIVDSWRSERTLGTKLLDEIVCITSRLATLRVSGPEEDSQGQGTTAVSILNDEVIPPKVCISSWCMCLFER